MSQFYTSLTARAPFDARVIEVLRIIVTEGKGIEGDPERRVFYYVMLSGEVLARNDEWENKQV